MTLFDNGHNAMATGCRALLRGKHLVVLLFIVGLALTWFQIRCALSLGEKKGYLLSIWNAPLDASNGAGGLPLSTVFRSPAVPYNRDYPSPVRNLLKVYIYDTIPKNIGQDVEDQLLQLYRNETYDNNWKAELALLQLFRSFPGRTWNPEEADICLVPYLHAGHCLLHEGWRLGCRHVSNELFMTQVFANLAYYNATTELESKTKSPNANKARHLFLALAGKDHSHKRIRYHSLLLTAGPRVADAPPGHIVVSQFNDAMLFQPSVMIQQEQQYRINDRTTTKHVHTNDSNHRGHDDWWTRPRKYAFVSHYGEINAAMRGLSGRKFRRFFRWDMLAYNKSTIGGGWPYRLSKLEYGGSNWREERQATYQQYQDSIFCPILAGDMAWQRRFFDAILSGCLPVVLSWELSNGETSWFVPETNDTMTYSVSQTYPFAKALFGGNGESTKELLAIDYESFVVQCPGNVSHEHNVSSLRTTMHSMLLHGTDDIRRRQLQMKEAAIAFSYGLGHDAHRYNDAFARIIRVLRYYVDH